MSIPPSSASSSSSSASQFTYTANSYYSAPYQPPQPFVAPSPAPAPPVATIPGATVYPQPIGPVPAVYSYPQYQAHQLFQRDAQTITPEALENVKAALASSETEHKAETKKRAIPRKAAGQSWEDPTLAEWPESNHCSSSNFYFPLEIDFLRLSVSDFPDDYRLFCGDLGNEVNDDVLSKAFARFPTFNMAKKENIIDLRYRDHDYLIHKEKDSVRVIRDKRTGKTKGYGFVSFLNPADLAAALKEMNGKYVGNRPIKLRKSSWKERTDQEAAERQKHHSNKKQKTVKKKSVLHK
ncbi:hypothetical protein Bca4012_085937 [Brassica carinata]